MLTTGLPLNQQQASKIMKQALKGEIEAYLTAQIIYEFFAVITNPKRVNMIIVSAETTILREQDV